MGTKARCIGPVGAATDPVKLGHQKAPRGSAYTDQRCAHPGDQWDSGLSLLIDGGGLREPFLPSVY